jgi:hypothetical protein
MTKIEIRYEPRRAWGYTFTARDGSCHWQHGFATAKDARHYGEQALQMRNRNSSHFDRIWGWSVRYTRSDFWAWSFHALGQDGDEVIKTGFLTLRGARRAAQSLIRQQIKQDQLEGDD